MKTMMNIKTDKEIYFSLVPKMTSKLERLVSRAKKRLQGKK